MSRISYLFVLLFVLSLFKLNASEIQYLYPEGWQYSPVLPDRSTVVQGINKETVYIAPYYHACYVGQNRFGCSVITGIQGFHDFDSGWIVKSPRRNDSTGVKKVAPSNIVPVISGQRYGAFKGCSNIRKLVLPPTMKYIGDKAFDGCAFNELVCMAVTPPTLENDESLKGVTIQKVVVPKGTKATYQAANGWKDFTIEEGAEAYSENQMVEYNGAWYEVINGEASLVNSDNLTDAKMPRTLDCLIKGEWKTVPVTSIRSWSIGHDIELNANITTIPDNWKDGFVSYAMFSFAEDHPIYRSLCPNVISDKSGKIAHYIFQKAIVPHGVTSIANNALNYCTQAYLPTTLTFIGKQSSQAKLYFTSEQPPSTTMSNFEGSVLAPEEYFANYSSGVFRTSNRSGIPAGYEYMEGDSYIAYWSPKKGTCILKKYIVGPEAIGSDGIITLPHECYYCEGMSGPIDEYHLSSLSKRDDVESIDKVRVPEGIKKLRTDYISYGYYSQYTSYYQYSFNELYLPSTLEECGLLSQTDGLKVIKVSASNPKYDSRDNCNALIETATNTIVCGCRTTSFPATVEHIADSAFYRVQNMPEIFTIPANIKTIGKGVFAETFGRIDSSVNPYQIEFAQNSQLLRIEDKTFFNAAISKVVFPNSLEAIGEEAFYDCEQLTEVVLGNSLKEIDSCAFYQCAITKLTLPDALKNIGSRAFWGCPLTELTFSDVLEEIGEMAFYGIPTLETVHFGKSLKSIGGGAFCSCGISLLQLPEGLTTIGAGAFQNCANLKELILPKSIKIIGDGAFAGCNNVTNLVFPMDSLQLIGGNALYSCYKPEELHLSETLTEWSFDSFNLSDLKVLYTDSPATIYLPEDDVLEKLEKVVIGNHKTSTDVFMSEKGKDYSTGFPNCPNLKEVVLGQSVEKIGNYAFIDLPISNIKIPKSLKSIGKNAFQGCNQLVETEISDLVAWCAIDFNSGDFSNPLSVSQKFVVNGEEVTDLVIPEGVIEINAWAFSGCKSLKSLRVPNSLKKIAHGSFSGCDSLDRLYISDIAAWCDITLESFFSASECHLFKGGKEIIDLVIPEGVDSIKPRVFYQCKGLNSVGVANSVTTIGEYAFYGCANLKSLHLGSCLSKIDYNVFDQCYNIESISVDNDNSMFDSRNNCNAIILKSSNTLLFGCKNTVIPDNVTSIGENAFYNCKGLAEIKIPSNVKTIDNFAFDSCTGLTSLILEEGVTSIGTCAFEGCSSLTTIKIPHSVKKIGDSSFWNCTNLASVTIGSGVENVSYGAFRSCVNLQDVFCYARQVPSTGSQIFYESNVGNATLHVPAASIEAYRSASEWKDFKNIVVFVMPKYQLKYVVDGEDYKMIEVESGETIIPIEEPTKGGCTFSGWIGLPETMPEHDVTVNGYFSFLVTINEITYSCGLSSKEAIVTLCQPKSAKLTIPSTVNVDGVDYAIKSIADDAFWGNFFVEELNISEGVQTIGKRAFRNCYGLKKLTLPSTLTKINDYAFGNCNLLSYVLVKWNEPINISNNVFGDSKWENGVEVITMPSATLFVPIGTMHKYQTAEGWNKFATVLEGELKEVTIDEVTYSYATGSKEAIVTLCQPTGTKLTIPSSIKVDGIVYSVTTIGAKAYLDRISDNIKELTISEGIKSIGTRAFGFCYELQRLTLPSTLTRIDDLAFYGCNKLRYVIANISEPFAISDNVFATLTYNDEGTVENPPTASLYVPVGTKSKYETTAGWDKFPRIVENQETAIDPVFAIGHPVMVYDMLGNKIRINASSLEGLPKGLYIVNGQKVVKK